MSGLPGDVLFHSQDGSVSLSFLPEFRARNQNSGSSFLHFRVPSLTFVVCPFNEDRFSLSRKSLQAYIERIASSRGAKFRLYISLNQRYT